jgi:hypothetical protein
MVAEASQLAVVHRGGDLVALQLAHPAGAKPDFLAHLG